MAPKSQTTYTGPTDKLFDSYETYIPSLKFN